MDLNIKKLLEELAIDVTAIPLETVDISQKGLTAQQIQRKFSYLRFLLVILCKGLYECYNSIIKTCQIIEIFNNCEAWI